jgi:putative photosynthetic complex assembly protein
MSGHHHHGEQLPRVALIGASACVIITLLLTGAVSLGLMAKPATMSERRSEQRISIVSQRDLLFLDQADGSVLIRDVANDQTAATMLPGSNSGFIRGVMRGLARDRHLRDLSGDKPFRLTLWSNQNLSLTDLATKRTIELNGFGDTNRAAFAALLEAKPTAVAAR